MNHETHGQASNDQMLKLYQAVLTSSHFHKVLRNRTTALSFLLNLFAATDLKNVSSIQHGQCYEPEAVEHYYAMARSQLKWLSVVWFCTLRAHFFESRPPSV